ncbi:MAG: hypothetical protein HKL80_08715 [Acidimicrobiales bacterium]|nr:hypothetical protein [Acidimicrobiales bacterium]
MTNSVLTTGSGRSEESGYDFCIDFNEFSKALAQCSEKPGEISNSIRLSLDPVSIGEKEFAVVMSRLSNIGINRNVSLTVLLAQLQGVSFAEAAGLLGVQTTKLQRMTRLEDFVSESLLKKRILPLAEVLRNLHQVLEPRATGKWFNTQIPSLDNKTPAELIKKNKLNDLLKITRSYVEPLAYL